MHLERAGALPPSAVLGVCAQQLLEWESQLLKHSPGGATQAVTDCFRSIFIFDASEGGATAAAVTDALWREGARDADDGVPHASSARLQGCLVGSEHESRRV